jgi:uncharacterized protein (DUF488 family)
MITLYTIGFTKKSARDFFLLLKNSGVIKIIDIRLNTTSQLAGFAKKNDLSFFLSEIFQCKYQHLPEFAPTKDILDGYHEKKISWSEYELLFKKLLEERKPGKFLSVIDLENACLLCAEPTPEKCHRRLVAEYLKSIFPEIVIRHL